MRGLRADLFSGVNGRLWFVGQWPDRSSGCASCAGKMPRGADFPHWETIYDRPMGALRVLLAEGNDAIIFVQRSTHKVNTEKMSPFEDVGKYAGTQQFQYMETLSQETNDILGYCK